MKMPLVGWRVGFVERMFGTDADETLPTLTLILPCDFQNPEDPQICV
jgi:hypothetical protein